MARTNVNYEKLSTSYLFVDIARRKKAFEKDHPGVTILSLGIGDTTEPIPPSVIEGLTLGVRNLSNVATYKGYGDEQGDARLREAIARSYAQRGVSMDADEVFVSDGAKSDSANIQSIFAQESVVAVQDPAYPVYVDSNVIAGRTGAATGTTYDGIVYLPCNERNNFFPSLPAKKVDLIYLCSPNNPTGAVATKEQLSAFVRYARERRAVIIFDAAYSAFISDPALPRSIYEVDGAKECAIEINSFSKSSGFTGVRLAWSIVPKTLAAEDAAAGRLHAMWHRRQTTMFNGASRISQEGGLAALSERGIAENKAVTGYYMENARLIRECLVRKGLRVFGGVNAPYLWVKTPGAMGSWEFFDKMLSETHVVVTPGAGMGPSGEGYIRISAFGHRSAIEEAVRNIDAGLVL